MMRDSQPFEQPAQGRCTIEDGAGYFRIKAPRNFNIFVVGFLCCWLVGWAFGWVSAAKEILVSLGALPNPTRHFFAATKPAPDLFLVFWLIMWTFGGGAALYFIAYQIGGSESVEFASDGITTTVSIFGWTRTKRYAISDVLNLRPNARIDRHGGGNYGATSCLSFDHGAKTIFTLSGVDEAEVRILLDRIGDRFPDWKRRIQ